MTTQTQQKNIVILGGGTAGWMAANLMATHWQQQNIKITLVESPDINIIGVGEGSTPPLKTFMDTIGVHESEWMAQCNATYKVAIEFRNWSTKPGFEHYFHPFLAQPDEFTAPAFFYNSLLIRKGIDLEGHPDKFFLASHLAKQKLAPIPPENFPFEINYGYHFDSGLLGKFLTQKAVSKGVKHLQTTVNGANVKNNGDIEFLTTTDGQKITGDFFVDATGFNGQLIQKLLKVPFISFANSLFNDSAVVFPTPALTEIAPKTTSTALNNGWAWHIPLTNRVGNGYVYSSSFCSTDEAETEFRQHLGLLDSDINARHLSIKIGRVAKHWANNCLAVGLSQGFIEPLEATALDMVQETVVRFIEAYQDGNFTNKNQEHFNQRINTRFDAVRDYIVGHYKINSRSDTEYWRANANNNHISPSLHAILSSWMAGQSITNELEKQKLDAYFPNISWNCMLAGYGLYPNKEQLKAGNELAHKYNMAHIEKYIRGCGLNFPKHMQALKKVAM